MFRIGVGVLVISGVAWLQACQPDDPTKDGPGAPTGSTDTETVPTPTGTTDTETTPTTSLAVTVHTLSGWPDHQQGAASGAHVALWTADGTSLEATTDEAGRAVFEGQSWEGASVTAWLDGHPLTSRVGLTGSEAEVELTLESTVTDASVVHLSGKALSVDTSGLAPGLIVSTSASQDESVPPDPTSWAIDVLEGVPFTLVAMNLHFGGVGHVADNPIEGWVVLDEPGVTEDSTLDLDFSQPTSPSLTNGSFPLPSAGILDDPGSYGFVYVDDLGPGMEEEGLSVGWATHTEFSGDLTTCDYDLAYVQPAALTDPWTCFRFISLQRGWTWSTTCRPGYPTSGPQDVVLLNPPEPTFSGQLGDPVTWELSDSGVEVELSLETPDGAPVWHLFAPTDATTLTVPPPPSGVDLSALAGGSELLPTLYVRRQDSSTRAEVVTLLPAMSF